LFIYSPLFHFVKGGGTVDILLDIINTSTQNSDTKLTTSSTHIPYVYMFKWKKKSIGTPKDHSETTPHISPRQSREPRKKKTKEEKHIQTLK